MISVQVTQAGGPEVLEVVEAPEPTPAPGRLVVKVAAIGVNFIDTYHRSGLYEMEMPFIPGMEGAGEVVAVGDGVEEFAEGDLVAWTDVMASYAEYISIP